jgi:hypothetical protein
MPEEAQRPVPGATGARFRLPAVPRSRASLIALGVAAAVVLGVVIWLLVRGGGHGGKPAVRTRASAASIRRLDAFASSIGHPVYWAGSQPSYTYELSKTNDGRVYIRYLPPRVKVGTPSPNYLTVGTYPQRNAFATLRATAKTQGIRPIPLAGGGFAFQYKRRPTSVYLAYPGSNYQIEVFDPSPSRALRLVTSGRIKPVGAPPRTAAGSRAVSVQQLRALAVGLGHPIYWVGAQQGDTYELTQTRDGSVYVRYLPVGVAVGTAKPNYLTVGTYPQKNALAVLKATAAKNHIATMSVAGGGVAFLDKRHPTSVYVSFPNLDLQMEVYDPAAGRAQQLVKAGRLRGIR